jgi:hypothetical protein
MPVALPPVAPAAAEPHDILVGLTIDSSTEALTKLSVAVFPGLDIFVKGLQDLGTDSKNKKGMPETLYKDLDKVTKVVASSLIKTYKVEWAGSNTTRLSRELSGKFQEARKKFDRSAVNGAESLLSNAVYDLLTQPMERFLAHAEHFSKHPIVNLILELRPRFALSRMCFATFGDHLDEVPNEKTLFLQEYHELCGGACKQEDMESLLTGERSVLSIINMAQSVDFD